MKAQCWAHSTGLMNMLPRAAAPKSSPELTGVTVIDVLITGGATVPSVAGTAETPGQVGANAMGATG